MKQIALIVIVTFIFISCNTNNKRSLPNVKGKAYELTIVIEKNDWKDTPGNLLKSIYNKEIANLPQPEPEFSITNIPHAAFSSIFKHHRNIIKVDIGNYKKTGVFFEKDAWAFPQYYVNIKAKDYNEFSKLFNNNKQKLFNFFEKSEISRMTEHYKKFVDKKLCDKIKTNHKINITIPKGYRLDVDSNDFMWISHETPKYTQSLFIYYYNYTDTNTFTKEYLISKRNKFLQKYVPGPTENSYMATEVNAPIIFNEYMNNGDYTAEIKGLWKVENNFMGGPFISLTKLDKKNNRVITVEGFAYYPNKSKRNLIKQLEVICRSLNVK